MKQRLNKRYGSYGQRRQVETVNSMIKRRLAAHTYWAQSRELMLLIATHNIMILMRVQVCYRALPTRFSSFETSMGQMFQFVDEHLKKRESG